MAAHLYLSAPAAGATELFAALASAGMPWGIVTKGSRNQRRKIELRGLASATQTMVIAEEVGYRKPDAAMFRLAAAALDLAPAAIQILFVGDNPVSDVLGAAQAGMIPVWLRCGRDWPMELGPPPAFMIDCLAEISRVIQLDHR